MNIHLHCLIPGKMGNSMTPVQKSSGMDFKKTKQKAHKIFLRNASPPISSKDLHINFSKKAPPSWNMASWLALSKDGILLMEEIPNNHHGMYKTVKPIVNNRINYQPQLVNDFFYQQVLLVPWRVASLMRCWKICRFAKPMRPKRHKSQIKRFRLPGRAMKRDTVPGQRRNGG